MFQTLELFFFQQRLHLQKRCTQREEHSALFKIWVIFLTSRLVECSINPCSFSDLIVRKLFILVMLTNVNNWGVIDCKCVDLISLDFFIHDVSIGLHSSLQHHYSTFTLVEFTVGLKGITITYRIILQLSLRTIQAMSLISSLLSA